MKRILLLSISIALIGLFLVSCGDSHSDIIDRNVIFNNQDMPLRSGNRWIYEYTDSINKVEKSFELIITGSDMLSNRHTFPCKTAYTNEDFFDELPIIRTQDSLIIPFFDLTVRTPLKVGASWENELLNTNEYVVTRDYSEVIDAYSSFYQNNRTFKDVVVIKRKRTYKNRNTLERFIFESYTFLAKDVGIITYIQQVRNIDVDYMVLQSKRYTLKSYTL